MGGGIDWFLSLFSIHLWIWFRQTRLFPLGQGKGRMVETLFHKLLLSTKKWEFQWINFCSSCLDEFFFFIYFNPRGPVWMARNQVPDHFIWNNFIKKQTVRTGEAGKWKGPCDVLLLFWLHSNSNCSEKIYRNGGLRYYLGNNTQKAL